MCDVLYLNGDRDKKPYLDSYFGNISLVGFYKNTGKSSLV